MRSFRLPSAFRCIIALAALAAITLAAGCGYAGPSGSPSLPPDNPQNNNVVSLNPQDWYIVYSPGMQPNPSTDPGGAWSFPFPQFPPSTNNSQAFPSGTGIVGYLLTPFKATEPLHQLTMTFEVENNNAQYHVMDPKDHPPATLHLIFAVRGFNLTDENDRWWANVPGFNNDGYNNGGYDLGSQDNQVLVMSVPLTSDYWTNVYGKQNANAFDAALKNVGWFGLTFGGQYFWGHGVTLTGGTAKFILINYVVD